MFLKRSPDQVIERDAAAAMHQEVEGRDRPHHGVFEAELIPEVLSDAPAFNVGDEQKHKNRECDRAREQPERQERPADELYAFWRDFENLPRFMEHLESVTVLTPLRSRWTAHAPAGTRVSWEAEIHNEIPNQLIAWRSLPGADVPNAGSVHFTPLGAGAGTEVRVVLSYEPPAGRVGAAVAKLFGEEPAQQVDEDLRRFKQVMESGDVPLPAAVQPS